MGKQRKNDKQGLSNICGKLMIVDFFLIMIPMISTGNIIRRITKKNNKKLIIISGFWLHIILLSE